VRVGLAAQALVGLVAVLVSGPLLLVMVVSVRRMRMALLALVGQVTSFLVVALVVLVGLRETICRAWAVLRILVVAVVEILFLLVILTAELV
jgi:hypothetical protein